MLKEGGGVGSSALFTFWSGGHVAAVSSPLLGDVTFSQTACHLNDVILLLTSGMTRHRYPRKVDWSRHTKFQKDTSTRMSVAGWNCWFITRQSGQQGRWAGSINVPALTSSIFALATNRTNKTKQYRLARHLSSLQCNINIVWNWAGFSTLS